MNVNFKKQLLNDFYLDEKDLFSKKNIFVVNKSDSSFFYNHRHALAIFFINDKVLVRSSNETLIEVLENEYKNCEGEWFSEACNIYKLNSILKDFNIKINNFYPIMVPPDKFDEGDFPYRVEIIYDDFERFKKYSKIAFSYDKGEFADLLGLAVYDDNDLLSLVGATKNGRYLCDIGIEKFDFDEKYKGIGALSVKLLLKNYWKIFLISAQFMLLNFPIQVQ